MEKFYAILCFILLGAASAFPANTLRFKHHAKTAQELTLKTPGYVVANEADTFKVSLILKEDFSAFTQGSIETPATTPVSTEAGWLPTSFTPNSGQWGGEQLYQAGGCAYIGLTESGLSGALTSPDLDLSQYEGNVIVTLRARKGKGNDAEAVRDWICCDMYEVNPNDPMTSATSSATMATHMTNGTSINSTTTSSAAKTRNTSSSSMAMTQPPMSMTSKSNFSNRMSMLP